MSAVRKDKASFKVDNVYFFIKSDTHGQYWCYRTFKFFTIKNGVIMHKKYSNSDFEEMDSDIQKAYQVWIAEKFLLN